jgi:putative hemolysin
MVAKPRSGKCRRLSQCIVPVAEKSGVLTEHFHRRPVRTANAGYVALDEAYCIERGGVNLLQTDSSIPPEVKSGVGKRSLCGAKHDFQESENSPVTIEGSLNEHELLKFSGEEPHFVCPTAAKQRLISLVREAAEASSPRAGEGCDV